MTADDLVKLLPCDTRGYKAETGALIADEADERDDSSGAVVSLGPRKKENDGKKAIYRAAAGFGTVRECFYAVTNVTLGDMERW